MDGQSKLMEGFIPIGRRACPMGFKMLLKTMLGFQATSRKAFEIQRLRFDRVCEGLQFCAKIKRFEVFMKEIWVFEVRVLNLYLRSFKCVYKKLCKSFWRSENEV